MRFLFTLIAHPGAGHTVRGWGAIQFGVLHICTYGMRLLCSLAVTVASGRLRIA
jgi:hypothetical protein